MQEIIIQNRPFFKHWLCRCKPGLLLKIEQKKRDDWLLEARLRTECKQHVDQNLIQISWRAGGTGSWWMKAFRISSDFCCIWGHPQSGFPAWAWNVQCLHVFWFLMWPTLGVFIDHFFHLILERVTCRSVDLPQNPKCRNKSRKRSQNANKPVSEGKSRLSSSSEKVEV